MTKALEEICSHEDSWPFLEPVDANDVPDYYDVVKVRAKFFAVLEKYTCKVLYCDWGFDLPGSDSGLGCVQDPIDLSLIKRRLQSRRYYLTLDIFTADLKRMFANCKLYNAVDTVYYKLSTKLEASFEYLLGMSIMTWLSNTARHEFVFPR